MQFLLKNIQNSTSTVPYLLFTFFTMLGHHTLYSQASTCNCCTEMHEQFDFWVGHWKVAANGKPAGNNVVDKIQDGCILRENWVSATQGYSGTSYNFYNLRSKQWEQLWIDNQGASLHLKGNRVENKMILESDELVNKQGNPYKNRITWVKNDDGTVRQLWEIIEGGKVTSTAFDGLYQKVQE